MSLPHNSVPQPTEGKEETIDETQTNGPGLSAARSEPDLEEAAEVKANKLDPGVTDKSVPSTQPDGSSPVRKFRGSSRFSALQPDDLNEDDVDEVEIDKLEISDTTDKPIPPSQPDDSSLIRELRSLAKNKPKLVRGKKYAVPGQSIELTSWKMTEWMYTKSPCPFPTLARGLFTRWIPARGHENDPEGTPRAGKDQIVVRGYDKFFNMNEVKWNTWEALEIHTTAPYTLTLKSNGCIIFMAALTPTELIVTSKHSLGEVEGASTSHAQKGEEWLEKHLEKAGKTKTEFSRTLFERNLTAVAELCDDSFEEHVLPYSKEMTGLHLHGLNERRVEFSTLGNDDVVAFAKEWGFIPTVAITLNTIEEVKKFTDKVSKEGKWRGEAVEGFVVRTKVSDRPPQLVQAYRGTRGERIVDKKELSTPPPYAPGSTFFFKIKFEEPYLMYREWRELTKKLLAADKKGQLRGVKPSSYMLRRPETRAYYRWIEDQIQHNPDSLKGFNDGHGIIATRERFLKWCETSEGEAALKKENGNSGGSTGPYKGSHKTIIMPVAIPGSGKTAVALALQHIYGFGHTQSDDVKQKRTGPQFAKNVVELFEKHTVVFADRNNHIRHLRDSLKEEFKEKYGDKGHIIALQWVFNDSPRNISEICASRIEDRGENHQSLHADRQDTHRAVISQFFGSFEEVEAEEVDDIIDMEYPDSLEQAVKRAISGIAPILDLKIPDDHKIDEACAVARSYTVKSMAGKKAKPKPPRYFALVPHIDVDKLIGKQFEGNHVPDSGKKMWNNLLNGQRVVDRPHVTLIHVKEKEDSLALWERCLALQKSAGEIEPSFKITFDHVVWNGNVMALSVSKVEMHRQFEDEHRQLAEAVVSQIPKKITDRLHLTIGTREDGINPFEAASMVVRWRDGTSTDVQCIPLGNCPVEAKFSGRYS
ncbi:RNA ligase-domain-containing protein [Rhizoctonia solani]|nr:RNA ligase-domain-containing protein [Rhizoctonia solani]